MTTGKKATGNIISVEDLKALHKPGRRLLGLDLGTKTIGLAISDGLLTVSSAFYTIKRTKFTADVAELKKIAEKEGVFGLVLGLPLNMDGSEGSRVQATRAFVRNLAAHCDLPVLLWDERLSTVAAERAMLEADLSRKKRAEKIDAAAAAVILQGVLERLQRL
ncbi:Holliday junction resolvase RuvX [Salaquimonas pukyongi]|uniref:Holliday junction resolvase RuvX n=1 Tax=Salaquimonas pukyongi TaxID=2712698 RepID=UPI0012EC9C1C|nr:Holliday junction resolvase RuvX [Salaquimonas pukyongi]